MTVRRRLIVASMAAVLLVPVVPAFAQVRRIQGTVVDEEGRPVAAAAIEATIVSLADVDFAVRNNDQTWRAQTNATGDYIVTVPAAGEYVVTATKDGVGSDRTKVAARSGLVTANLTLWKPAAAAVPVQNCGTGTSIGAFERSGLAAGADRGLRTIVRLDRSRAPAYTRLQGRAAHRSGPLAVTRARNAVARHPRARGVFAEGAGRTWGAHWPSKRPA